MASECGQLCTLCTACGRPLNYHTCVVILYFFVLLPFTCRSHTTSVGVPNALNQATIPLDSKKSRHKIVHDFEVWGAKAKADGEDEELEQREARCHRSVESLDRDSLHSHLHEVVDMEQSEEHRVGELVQVLLQRRMRMEQELAQGMHLLHTMRANLPGPGDWMHADSESNLVSQENVGYQYHTVMHRKDASTTEKQCSHTRADSPRNDGKALKNPASSDSPLPLPTAGRKCVQKSTKNEGEVSQHQFGFRLPGEVPLTSQELNSASTTPRQRSVDSSSSSMEHLL